MDLTINFKREFWIVKANYLLRKRPRDALIRKARQIIRTTSIILLPLALFLRHNRRLNSPRKRISFNFRQLISTFLHDPGKIRLQSCHSASITL